MLNKPSVPKNDEQFNIKATKTRQEICLEYGFSYKVFTGKLEYHGIELPPGIITPKYQMLIYEALGVPPRYLKNKRGQKRQKTSY